jgi:hypothetical protein
MSVSHHLAQEEALRRIKALLTQVKSQYSDMISDLHEVWEDNIGTFSFRAKGFQVSGVLAVADSRVELAGKIPIMALPFRGMIEDTIRERAETLLA